MSQAGSIGTTTVVPVLPPQVATQYVTNNGTATPVAYILNVLATDTNINNDAGIDITGSGDTITVLLTNRITGFISTNDATPVNIVSVPLGVVPGTYIAQGSLVAYNVTDAAGAAYEFSGAAVTDGVTATEIGSEEKTIFEQAAMVAADFVYGVTGNTAFVRVTGLPGKVINWSELFTYRFVG